MVPKDVHALSLELVSMLYYCMPKGTSQMWLDFEMERLFRIIWWAQCNYNGPYKREARGSKWVKMSWRKQSHSDIWLHCTAGFQDGRRGHESKNAGGLWAGKGFRQFVSKDLRGTASSSINTRGKPFNMNAAMLLISFYCWARDLKILMTKIFYHQTPSSGRKSMKTAPRGHFQHQALKEASYPFLKCIQRKDEYRMSTALAN